jgi:hypothetical protein
VTTEFAPEIAFISDFNEATGGITMNFSDIVPAFLVHNIRIFLVFIVLYVFYPLGEDVLGHS